MSAPASPFAKRIVRVIVDDLRQRRGLKQEWEAADGVTQGEVEQRWCELVDEQLRGSVL